ncbi:MAG: ASCH domain-containing protein [Hungatella sp.]|nr:ASCH domain-containing protein [Hungatella sp.]
MKALLSIKPVFVEEIMAGNKRFEYRKRIFKQDVDSVVIYASMPVGKIVGEFKIGEIINKSPKDVWQETKDYSGISYRFFQSYFKGKKEAYAIQIKEFVPYDIPIDPYKDDINFVPPQSYKYIYENDEK